MPGVAGSDDDSPQVIESDAAPQKRQRLRRRKSEASKPEEAAEDLSAEPAEVAWRVQSKGEAKFSSDALKNLRQQRPSSSKQVIPSSNVLVIL